MKNKIKRKLYSILKNEFLANMICPLFYLVAIFIFFIQKVFVAKPKIDYDAEQSRNILDKIYPNKVNIPTGEAYEDCFDYDISVIIPCYNIEKYVGECINSVLNQKGNLKIQIVCVNDGSTDNTLEVLNSFKDRITIINTVNNGSGVARNIGIDNAKGKYLFFLDSDDYLLPYCLIDCINTLEKNRFDFVSVGYCDFYDNKMIKRYGNSFCWGILYKREMFSVCRFPNNNVFEDTIKPFVLETSQYKSIHIDKAYYMRRILNSSITASVKKTLRGIGHLWVVESLAKFDRDNKMSTPEELYKLVLKHLGTVLLDRIGQYDMEIKYAAFMVASEILKNYSVDSVNKLTYQNKKVQKYLLNNNYRGWELACKWL